MILFGYNQETIFFFNLWLSVKQTSDNLIWALNELHDFTWWHELCVQKSLLHLIELTHDFTWWLDGCHDFHFCVQKSLMHLIELTYQIDAIGMIYQM